MTVYLDTSVVVPLFLDDDHSFRARAWAASEQAVVLSAWMMTEFSSALSMQVRLKAITGIERSRVEGAFDLWAGQGQLIDFQPDRFTDARALLQRHPRLRGPDALHLAIVRWNGLKLATLDNVMKDAAVAERLEVVDL